jgi:hypothetical protein
MRIIHLLISNKKIIIFLILPNVVNPNPRIALPIKQNQTIKFHKQQDNRQNCTINQTEIKVKKRKENTQ